MGLPAEAGSGTPRRAPRAVLQTEPLDLLIVRA
jgi:hypothetical protein